MKHTTVGEVRATIRTSLLAEESFLAKYSSSTHSNSPLADTKGAIRAYKQVLGWLSDLEKA